MTKPYETERDARESRAAHPGQPTRCKGHRRVQRRGSRTLHRLIFKIRDGRQAAARRQEGMGHHV